MSATIANLEDFLAAPIEQVAAAAPATMIFAPGGTRRRAALAGISPQSEAYAQWSREQMIACCGRWFEHGIRHLFMNILRPAQLAETGRYRERLLNIHPSLLPAFPGLHTHERALAAGVKLHGCTVHFVTADLDHGPIVLQAAVPVRPGDDAATLAARVLKQEHVIYPRAARWFLEGKLSIHDGLVRVKGDDAQLVLAGD